jgi:aspartate/glutamate racemase
MRIGFLHTVPALAPRFDADLNASVPDATAVHAIDAELLATAIRSGVDEAVEAAVAAHIEHLAADGADAVLVTCSSIGEAVEKAAANTNVPVVRVDTAMADEAVATAGPGGRIAVLATLEATLGPTGRILERAAAAASESPTVTATVVEGAAAARSAGDDATHDRLIAEAVRAADADVIVLAQASMAPAAEQAGSTVPMLTSPASALAAVLEAAR